MRFGHEDGRGGEEGGGPRLRDDTQGEDEDLSPANKQDRLSMRPAWQQGGQGGTRNRYVDSFPLIFSLNHNSSVSFQAFPDPTSLLNPVVLRDPRLVTD